VVVITVGRQSIRLNLGSATVIDVDPYREIDNVFCTIVALQAGKEVGRLCHAIHVPGSSLRRGLIAYYPFNGDAKDASGNGKHAIVDGPTLTTDRFGNEKGAYNFGAPGCIETPVHIDHSSSGPGVTYTAWVRPTGQPRSFAGYVVSCPGWSIRAGDQYWEVQRVQAPYFPQTRLTVDLNRWQFVAAVFIPGKSVGVYKNDRSQTVKDTRHGPTDHRIVWIGASPHYGKGNHLFRGKIDDVRIYERALDEAEIQALYRQGRLPRTSRP
jgi:hypothetical protein